MKPNRLIGPILAWLLCAALWVVLCLLAGSVGRAAEIRVRWMAGAEPLEFGQTRLTNTSGQAMTFTRWDTILSGLAFHQVGGGWIARSNWVAVFEGTAEPASARLGGLPAGRYDRVRFDIGLTPAMNHRDAATWPADHPLNPARSGLHWGWSGSWVFAAIEGHWSDTAGRVHGFSFHLATDAHRRTVEREIDFAAGEHADLEVVFDAARFVGGTNILASLASPAAAANGNWVLSWTGIEGGGYTVERSQDLEVWTAVAESTLAGGDTAAVTVASAGDVAAFRVRLNAVATHDAVDGTGNNNGGGGATGPALASVAPGSGTRGTSVRVTFTLGGMAPPANIQPTSASLGTLAGTALARNGTQVSATFNIPANATPGRVTAAVVFPGPPGMGNVTFSLANGFTIQ